MTQPEALNTEAYLPWSRGRGVDVWAMFRAAADGVLARVQALAASHPALVECEYKYRTPLHFAVQHDRRDVIRFLLTNGAEPTRLDQDPPHPLVAEHIGYDPAVAALAARIRAREPVEIDPALLGGGDHRGNRPFHWAVMTRQLGLIDRLLAQGADIDAARPDGATALHLSNGDYHYRGGRDLPAEALRPHTVLIGYLLARGASYDLSMASKLGDVARVRELLDADPEAVNRLPAHTGYYNGLPLRNAAAAGHRALVEFLLERGANPNQPEPLAPFGGALLEAIGNRHYEIAQLLIERGADVNGAVESSGNCLWRAQQNKAPAALLDALLTRGAKLPLDIACYDGNIELVEEILAGQALPEDAFRQAVVEGHRHLIEHFLARDPALLRRYSFDGAPSLDFARWLLEKGQDPRPPNWLGTTALHRLAGAGNLEMAKLCLEFGADPQARDDEGLTPRDWALRRSHTQLAALLA